MWICQHCGADVEEAWDTCWNCLWSRDGTPPADAALERRDSLSDNRDTETPSRWHNLSPVACLRCQTQLQFLGTRGFHESSFWLGNLGELLTNHERFDVYACPRCGHVEFFLAGTGEDGAPQA